MSTMASQITSLTVVYSTVYSCADQRKHLSSASPAFVRGIRRWPVNSPRKGPVTRKKVVRRWTGEEVRVPLMLEILIIYRRLYGMGICFIIRNNCIEMFIHMISLFVLKCIRKHHYLSLHTLALISRFSAMAMHFCVIWWFHVAWEFRLLWIPTTQNVSRVRSAKQHLKHLIRLQ